MTPATHVIAVDPGPVQSAVVVLHQGMIFSPRILPNDELRLELAGSTTRGSGVLAVEMIASYGMPVGAEVFETCLWIGRLIEAWGGPYAKVYRKDVKLHLCGSTRAKDANIRQALLDRWGAQGTKSAPGPTYGLKADMWAALAVGTWFVDNHVDQLERRGA